MGALRGNKDIKGVIGYSLGTETVWEVFKNHSAEFKEVPFFLMATIVDESRGEVRGAPVRDHPSFAGSSPFWCGWLCHVKNASPAEVFDAFAPWN